MIESAIPEIGGVLSEQTSIKKAAKKTGKSTIRKQDGGGIKKEKTLDKVLLLLENSQTLKNLD